MRTIGISLLIIPSLLVTLVHAQTVSTLSNNQAVSVLSMTRGEKRYYSITVPSGSTNLRISTTGSTGDADIYVGRGKIPTRGSFSWSSTKYRSTESVLVRTPVTDTYNVLLYAYSNTTNTNLTVTYTGGNATTPTTSSTPNTQTTTPTPTTTTQTTTTPTTTTSSSNMSGLKSVQSGLCMSVTLVTSGTLFTQQNCSVATPITEIPKDIGIELRITGTSYCLDIPSGQTANGTGAQVYSCDSSNDQRFTVTTNGSNRIYQNIASGKCLDVGSSGTVGHKVQLWDCDSSLEQQYITSSGTVTTPTVSSNTTTTTTQTTTSSPISTTPAGTVPSGNVSTTFSTTNMELENPERGWFFHIQAGSEACNGLLTQIRDGQILGQKARLAYYDVDLRNISESTLTSDFKCIRDAGMKIIFSQSSCSSLGCSEGISIEQVENKLASLKPILEANKDIIAFARAGVIGGWGEWATWQGGVVPESIKTRVKNALMGALPASVSINFRTPPYIQSIYPNVVNSSTAFTSSEQSRMGFQNDCFLAEPSDGWTYPGVTNQVTPAYTTDSTNQRAYAAAMTEYVPSGAETCMNSSNSGPSVARLKCYTDASDYNGGKDNAGQMGGIMREGPRYHLAYMHRAYEVAYPNSWNSAAGGNCYGDVTNFMGYRFQLDSINHPGTAGKGSTIIVNVDLRDIGWSRIFSARKLVVTLKNKSTGETIQGSAGDMRLLPSQATASTRISVPITIPSTASTGDYDVYVSMPDIYTTTANIAAYAVRFANADNSSKGQAWDATTARFKVGTTLTITTGTPTTTTSQTTVVATNGSCGSSSGQALTSSPTSNLCSSGTASSITGSGPWSWSCNGSNGGSNAICGASKMVSTQTTTSNQTPAIIPSSQPGVEWTGVTTAMWNEINTQRAIFGDTNNCQQQVNAIPTSGGVTLSPGQDINAALANNSIVFLSGGTYPISSRIYIPDGKKLIGVAGQTVILDGSNIDYPVLPGSNVVLANVRIQNAQGDGVLFFDRTASNGSAHNSLIYQVVSDRSGYNNMNGDNSAGIRMVDGASHNCIVSVEVSNTWNEVGGVNYHGGNADGLDSAYGSHDNTFIDVHSHNNGDDGVDMWMGGVAFWYFSTSHDNGKVPGKDNQGNGNGVKLGPGPGGVCGPGVTHRAYKFSSYNNAQRGFDINGNTKPADLVQYSSTGNGAADWLVWNPDTGTCPNGWQ